MHEDEAVTSLRELHENETTPSVIETQEFEETETVALQSSPPVERVTADSAISDEGITDVQDSAPSSPVPVNLTNHVPGKMFGFI